MTKDRSRGVTHSKWFLPSFSSSSAWSSSRWPGWAGNRPRECLGLRQPDRVRPALPARRAQRDDPRAARRRPRRAVRADRPAGDRGRRAGPARRADRRLAGGHRPGPERYSLRLAPRHRRAGLSARGGLGPLARSRPARRSGLAQRGGVLLDVVGPAVGQAGTLARERHGPGDAPPGLRLVEGEHGSRRLAQGQRVDARSRRSCPGQSHGWSARLPRT